MNNPKFHIHATLNEADYVRFNHTLVWRNKKTKWIIAISLFSCILIIVPYLLNLQPSSSILYYLPPLFIIVSLLWHYTRGIDKIAAKLFRTNNLAVNFEVFFYDDYLEFKGKSSSAIWCYNELHEIIVTKTDIYIMRTPQIGICLQKDICPNGFMDYIDNLKTHCTLSAMQTNCSK